MRKETGDYDNNANVKLLHYIGSLPLGKYVRSEFLE
jgi:hypothetical protein